ncbi:PD-(D/E)XK nuclease family transposase, partial [Clostridium sp. MCC353]|uniref:PD-(D/E)XK nuclease family transposase n=1 Tax=Clostridium sp. MCC353 TaxID=2592646 RepID=UPI001C00B961
MEEGKDRVFLTANLMDRKEKERIIHELAESEKELNICLTNDFAFKKTFRNKTALTGLLSALLDMPAGDIEELEFPDTYLHGEYEEDREGILDVRVHLNNKRKINIE